MTKRRLTRSSLFHGAAGLTEKFSEHFCAVWKLSTQQRALVLAGMAEIFNAETDRDLRIAREDLVSRIKGDKQVCLQAVSVLEYLSEKWRPVSDSVAAVLDDIEALHVLPKAKNERDSARVFLRKYLSLLEKDSPRRLKISYASRFLPSLLNFDTVIDMRAVFASIFDWRHDDPEEYRPKHVGNVDVIVVRVKLDQGDPIVFQCEKTDVESIIRQLQSCLKELAASKA